MAKISQIILFILVISCSSLLYQSAQNKIIFKDQNYSQRVGMVTLKPSKNSSFNMPVINLGESIMLEFDLFDQDYSYLIGKIFHCNSDWSPSILKDLEYLDEINQIPINNYNISQNNYIHYISYSVKLAKVNKSGNFIIAIYDSNDMNKPLFTRKYMVVKNQISINATINRSSSVKYRNSHHQIEFSFKFPQNITNPIDAFKPIILQNHNWQNAIVGLKPTATYIDKKTLEYRHFNQENNFPAGNEFRFFDFQSIRYLGQNVKKLERDINNLKIILEQDKSRFGLAYTEPYIQDLNGYFNIQNNDPNTIMLQSEYVFVTFNLKNPKINGDVYVVGRFNNWATDDSNKMKYDSLNQNYKAEILLKQGFYNYYYWIKDANLPSYYFEGSHFQTKNDYEILIYYREPGTFYDQLIGYQQF